MKKHYKGFIVFICVTFLMAGYGGFGCGESTGDSEAESGNTTVNANMSFVLGGITITSWHID